MDAGTIAEIVGSIAEPQIFSVDDQHKFAFIPPGHSVRAIPANELPPPEYIQQCVAMLTPKDFIAYVERFEKCSPTAMIFADEPRAHYVCILDYHNPDGTRDYGEHQVRYTCPQSDEWKLWMSQNGKMMQQGDFAKFLEENLPDIYSPPAADLLQVALSLEVHKAAKFDSDIRLDNGQRQFTYQETIRGAVRQGNLTIPELFTINIPVFVDGVRYKLDARLRYRMTEGNLVLWYDLVRHNDVWRSAVQDVTKEIADGLPDVSLVRGTPK